MTFVATREIGLRALRRELTSVMRQVRAGDQVVVKERGVPVARITPVEAGQDALERLRREGRLIPPREPKEPIREGELIRAKGSLSDLVIAQRERKRKP